MSSHLFVSTAVFHHLEDMLTFAQLFPPPDRNLGAFSHDLCSAVLNVSPHKDLHQARELTKLYIHPFFSCVLHLLPY